MNIVHGDAVKLLKDGVFDILIHGVNCQGVMGAGIAKQIKNEFPLVYKGYLDVVFRNNDQKDVLLGDVYLTSVVNDKGELAYICNAFTQMFYGSYHKAFDYMALRNCLIHLKNDYCQFKKDVRIAYPKIGAGRGKGDWTVISKIIEEELSGYNHTLVTL